MENVLHGNSYSVPDGFSDSWGYSTGSGDTSYIAKGSAAATGSLVGWHLVFVSGGYIGCGDVLASIELFEHPTPIDLVFNISPCTAVTVAVRRVPSYPGDPEDSVILGPASLTLSPADPEPEPDGCFWTDLVECREDCVATSGIVLGVDMSIIPADGAAYDILLPFDNRLGFWYSNGEYRINDWSVAGGSIYQGEVYDTVVVPQGESASHPDAIRTTILCPLSEPYVELDAIKIGDGGYNGAQVAVGTRYIFFRNPCVMGQTTVEITGVWSGTLTVEDVGVFSGPCTFEWCTDGDVFVSVCGTLFQFERSDPTCY